MVESYWEEIVFYGAKHASLFLKFGYQGTKLYFVTLKKCTMKLGEEGVKNGKREHGVLGEAFI